MTPEEFLEIRRSLNLTQPQMAEMLGLCIRTIRKYETGKGPISKPVVLLLEKIKSNHNKRD